MFGGDQRDTARQPYRPVGTVRTGADGEYRAMLAPPPGDPRTRAAVERSAVRRRMCGRDDLQRCAGHCAEGFSYRHHSRERASDHMAGRSEEHTSELQSLMRISYAVFCLKKKKTITEHLYS